uniref:Uncharacterized protein AlNc14C7G973 n=1 Tax=Albugo laibachii Nc14 TaxID=890382 RepID=F0W1N1_9STRA|nr:conserved hypothetical protein [Albugo laibachii Nc14]|eukprot:CCA14960.1 conserved hypothetical protein [Albugo laibachii Nc14]
MNIFTQIPHERQDADASCARNSTISPCSVSASTSTSSLERKPSFSQPTSNFPERMNVFDNAALREDYDDATLKNEELRNEKERKSMRSEGLIIPFDKNASKNSYSDNLMDPTLISIPVQTGNYVAILPSGAKARSANRRCTVPCTIEDLRTRDFVSEDCNNNSLGDNKLLRQSLPQPLPPLLRSHASVNTDSNSLKAVGSSRRRFSSFNTQRAQNGIVPCSGWLTIAIGSSRSRWKQYYVVLSGLELRYSKKPGHTPEAIGMLKCIKTWDQETHGLVFEAGTFTLNACCKSGGQVQKWLKAIEEAMDREKRIAASDTTTAYSFRNSNKSHEGILNRYSPSKTITKRSHQWKKCIFHIRQGDGYLSCRELPQDAEPASLQRAKSASLSSLSDGAIDEECSGYVTGITIAEGFDFGLGIELENVSVLVQAESYDDYMLWYTAISAAISSLDRSVHPGGITSIRSSFIDSFCPNYSGWMYKQVGILRQWKLQYFTLHGGEIGYARDSTSRLSHCEKVISVSNWDDKLHGLRIKLQSGRIWRVYLESYQSASHWRKILTDAASQDYSQAQLKRYIATRKRHNESIIYAGWLSLSEPGREPEQHRRFYVLEQGIVGCADDVNHQLSPIGMVVDITASRDQEFGILVTFANRKKLLLIADSVDSTRAWFECLKQCIPRS